MEIIKKYFPAITEQQQEQFAALKSLYEDWNQKINVISRKDIDNLYEHHVLHSLAIAKALNFKPGTRLLDFGTGGGFPGIPLAIMFPECQFKLIDGTGKKIRVAVSRAVMPLPDLMKIVRKNIGKKHNNAMMNGVFVLKGGNVDGEIHPFRKSAEVTALSNWFSEEWFNEKYLIYVPV